MSSVHGIIGTNMKSNVIFAVAVPSKHLTDVGEYSSYSLRSWKSYADRVGAKLVVMEEPVTDPDQMKMTWQRWYVHDILENSGIEYDNILMVDVDTIVHWAAPDIFKVILNPGSWFSACVDNDNLGWLKASIDGYQHMFPEITLDWEKYFNCGVILMGKKHKDLCKEITTFYEENEGHLDLQHNTLKKGSDQTPVNYILNSGKWKYKLLPKKWNLTHMNRKEVLNNFIFKDVGWVYHFNGFDKSIRTQVMKAFWDNFKGNYEVK